MRKLFRFLSAAVWGLMACTAPVLADPVAEHFSGKTISLLIGTTPGGGYDGYARVLARHWGRHIPGNPKIVAKNMPGAGGLTLANYLYNQAPRDGTEIGTLQSGVAFEKLFQTLSPDGKNARYDATQFGWIGSALRTVYVTVTWHDAPVKSLAEATAKEAILGSTAASSDNHLLATLGNKVLGTKFKIVQGYDGSNALDLAIERGEVHGAAGKDWTTITSSRPDWLRDKKINILVQMGMQAHPDLKDVPLALDLAKTPEDRQILELVFAKFNLARPYLAPPGLPPAYLAAFRRSFDSVLKDPEFLADAKRSGMEVNPLDGEEVQALVEKMLKTPDALATRARAVLQP
jgi:tripartite-type tricarboxylate transporter receptor subunit TctC